MPRNKSTAPYKPKPGKPESNLSILSAEEEKLVEAVALGADNSEAYKRAYGAEGYSAAALRVRACRKIAEPKIQEHLRALRSVGVANSKLTLERRMEDELSFAQRAEDAGNYGAAGGAYDRVNKLLGLYIERTMEIAADPMSTLDELARLSPELARKLAEDEGIAWSGGTQH